MLRSLLLSGDDNTVRIVRRGFKDLAVGLEHFAESNAALLHLTKNRYDAIVVDDQIEEAHIVVEQLIALPACNKSVRIVLAEPVATMHAVFKTGTQVILYKPLSPERVRQGLRAVRNLMGRDRRRGSSRVATTLTARIRYGKGAGTQVFIADISDSGAAIHCGDGGLPYSGNLHLDFALPEDTDRIHVTAELV